MAEKKEHHFHIESFSRSITPLPTEVEHTGSSNMVYWGDDNLYPNFLLRLYDTVPLHQSIANSKVDYLIGEGMVDKATKKPLTRKLSLSESNEEFAQKVIFDFVLSGWIIVGVQYNVFGEPIFVYHIPFNHTRTNKAKSIFYVCDEWDRATTILSYPAFKAGKSVGGYTKIYAYKAYTPSVKNVYPSIPYSSAITNMVTEALLNDFSKNDVEDGFSAAHIISFFKGMPNSDQADEFDRKFKKAYSGDGLKVLIDYNNPKSNQSVDNSIQVKTIDSPDYGTKLDALNKKNETNILTAHQATSKALFGLEQAAGLNGNDLENAFQIFKEVYVKNKRNKAEDALNTLFRSIGFEEIEFKDKGTALPVMISATTKEKIYTKNELRVMDGAATIEGGDVFLEQPKAISAGQSFAFNTEAKKGRILKEEDFELIAHLGTTKHDFDLLDEGTFSSFRLQQLAFDDAADIDDFLLKNDTSEMSISEIRAAIRKELGIAVTAKELETKISRLKEAGVIGEKPEKKLTRDVKVLYQYEVREGYGKRLIPTSRGFCVKLIENDRYYTREEIQQMSAIFGYDVFKHCGGWYFNPNTEEAESHCRHYFKSVRVIKKAN